jgi:hypothetical protein
MTATNGDFNRLSCPIHSLLRSGKAWYGLESHTENNVVAIADTALDAS